MPKAFFTLRFQVEILNILSVPVIDKLDYVFSENGLVAKGKGVEIERNVSTKLYNYRTPHINTELFVTVF